MTRRETIEVAIETHRSDSKGVCQCEPGTVLWSVEHVTDAVLDALDTRVTVVLDLADEAKRLLSEWQSSAKNCTCGYGGYHEPENKRCERNNS